MNFNLLRKMKVVTIENKEKLTLKNFLIKLIY